MQELIFQVRNGLAAIPFLDVLKRQRERLVRLEKSGRPRLLDQHSRGEFEVSARLGARTCDGDAHRLAFSLR